MGLAELMRTFMDPSGSRLKASSALVEEILMEFASALPYLDVDFDAALESALIKREFSLEHHPSAPSPSALRFLG